MKEIHDSGIGKLLFTGGSHLVIPAPLFCHSGLVPESRFPLFGFRDKPGMTRSAIRGLEKFPSWEGWQAESVLLPPKEGK
jgi:hypothetical protein